MLRPRQKNPAVQLFGLVGQTAALAPDRQLESGIHPEGPRRSWAAWRSAEIHLSA
jgi:hypothetical protein